MKSPLFGVFSRVMSSAAVCTFSVLASASAWALDFPAAVDGVATFDVQNGMYVATGDITDYKQMKITATGTVLDLGQYSMSIPSDSKANPVVFPSAGLAATLKNGTWNFGGNGKCELHVQDDGENKGSETLVVDGAVIQNLYNIVIANAKSNNTLVLTNGANVSAQNFRITSGAGHDNAIRVFDSTLTLSGNFIPEEASITDGVGNNAASRLLAVGSSISVPNKAVVLGRGRPNDVFVLEGESSFASAGLTIGSSGTNSKGVTAYDGSNNSFAVTNSTLTSTSDVKVGLDGADNALRLSDATMNVTGEIQVGLGERGHGNVLEATNSTITCSSGFGIGSEGAASNNTVVLHDVVLSAYSLSIGTEERASGNRLCLGGSKGGLTLKNRPSEEPFFFGAGGGNEVCLFDHFADSISGNVNLMVKAPGNTLRVASGASVSHNTGSISIGQSSSKSTGNTLRIEDGASFTAYRFALYGKDNTVVVSNATLYTERNQVTSTTSLCIGAAVGDVDPSVTDVANNRLVLQGVSPSCGSKGETYVGSSGSVTFDLPAAALETVPLAAGMVTFVEGSAIHVECDDYLSYLGDERGTLVLARASDKSRITIPPSVLDAANAELPERCRLVVSGTDLLLKTRGNKGLLLLFR